MNDDARSVMERLRAVGEGALSPQDKLALLLTVRSQSPALSREIDRLLLADYLSMGAGLREAQAIQQKLRGLLRRLTAPPRYPAVFLRHVHDGGDELRLAEVVFAGSRRVVTLADAAAEAPLVSGDEVLLNSDLNAALEKSPDGSPGVGEVAYYDRPMPDGRLVLKSRDEELVVSPSARLEGVELKPGDLVRWSKEAWMALEKLEGGAARQFLLEDAPRVGPEAVGGQQQNLARLLGGLRAHLLNPELARAYGMENARGTILMVGPPGCGKTLMARVAAAEVSRVSGKSCRFAVVKPGEWRNPFVGVTEENIRNTFKMLDEACRDGFAILFLDEIEVIGRTRGSFVGHHADRFLAALLTELDGFKDHKNVAIISATNRKDLIDPALLERLSGEEIEVNRPDRRGAREIFAIHLPQTLPYNPDSASAESARQEIIEVAVARFYAEGPEGELCVLHLRDHTTRTVSARELVSGRLIEQVCRSARRAAFLRQVNGGEAGLTVGDIEAATTRALQRLASTITIRNARDHLTGLDDADIVRVEPTNRRVRQPRRYLCLELS